MACLLTSWLCARRVCFTWEDVPEKPSAFYRTSICVVAVVVTASLPECLWVDTNSTRTHARPRVLFSFFFLSGAQGRCFYSAWLLHHMLILQNCPGILANTNIWRRKKKNCLPALICQSMNSAIVGEIMEIITPFQCRIPAGIAI